MAHRRFIGLAALVGALASTSCGTCADLASSRPIVRDSHWSLAAIALDGAWVYAAPPALGVVRAPKAGGASQTLVPWDTTRDVADFDVGAGVVTFVYANAGPGPAVLRVPAAGGAVVELAPIASPEEENPHSVVSDGAHVYWATCGRRSHADAACSPDDHAVNSTRYPLGLVRRVPVSGGPAETLATGVKNQASLVHAAPYVFVTEAGTFAPGVGTSYRGDGAVRRIDTGTGRVDTIATGLDRPRDAAARGDHVYFFAGGDLARVSFAGGAPTIVARDVQPRAFALGARDVYFLRAKPIGKDDRGVTISKWTLWVTSLAGANEAPFLELGHRGPDSMAADDEHLFYADGDIGDGGLRKRRLR